MASWCVMLWTQLWTWGFILGLSGYSVIADSDILSRDGEVKEYCQLEQFRAECSENEVIVVTLAFYGRMRLGRCVRQAYGSLGCSTNVLDQLDRFCSGQQECSFAVSSLHNKHPCPTDLTPFLEAVYYCQPVNPGPPQGCSPSNQNMLVKGTSGFIGNHLTMDTGRGSDSCPWKIQVPAGQRINITLINFARTAVGTEDEASLLLSKPNICYQFALFTEGDYSRTVTQCEGSDTSRVVHALLSLSSTVEITILTKKDMEVYFLLYYEAVGCPQPVISPNHWVQRTDNTAIVKCNNTGESWKLKCVNDAWEGSAGNCTATAKKDWHVGNMFEGNTFPYSILIVVAIGVALGVFLGGILLVCASKYIKRKRHGQLRNVQFQEGLYGTEHGKILVSQFDEVGGGSPMSRTLHYHGGTNIDDVTHIAQTSDKECKCPGTYTSYGPGPGYHPPTHHIHMYESPQFERKDSR